MRFIIVKDEAHTAYINGEAIAMFRTATDEQGRLAEHLEVEIEFIGGTKTKLHDESAQHFLHAILSASKYTPPSA